MSAVEEKVLVETPVERIRRGEFTVERTRQ